MRKNERGLSMNRAPSPRPSPPLGERVSEGRVRGISTGSWSLCMPKNESVLSVGRQVLDCASPLALFDWVSGRKSGRGLPHSKMLSRRHTHLRDSQSNACRKTKEGLFIRQVLDCASPLALFDRVSGRKSGRGLPQSMMLSRRRTHLRDSQSNACGKTKEVSMNQRTPSPRPSPPLGERVSKGRLRGPLAGSTNPQRAVTLNSPCKSNAISVNYVPKTRCDYKQKQSSD